MLKKRINALLSILIIVTLVITGVVTGTVVSDAATLTGTCYVDSSDGAVLRSSYSTSSSRVCVLDNNCKLTIKKIVFTSKTKTSASHKWYQVTASNGKNGYIRSDLVKKKTYSGTTATVTKSCNYRTGAGTGMKLKGTLKKGQKVKIRLKAKPVSSAQGSSSTWYMIEVGSVVYYAASTYFSLSSNTVSADTSSGSGSSGSATQSDTSSSSQNSTASSSQNTIMSATGKVDSGSGAYLRSSTSTSSSAVKLLSDNTSLNISKVIFKSSTSTSATNKWYKVSVSGKNGYIRSDCVDSVKYNTVSATVKKSCNYRSGAGTGMSAKGTLSAGSKVDLCLEATPTSSTQGSSSTWYMFKKGSTYYYAASTYFTIDKAVVKESETKQNDPVSEKAIDEKSADETKPTPDEKTDITESDKQVDVVSKANEGSGMVDSWDGAYVRSEPNTKSDKVTLLSNNTLVTIAKEVFVSDSGAGATDKWYYISINGKKGYIRSDLVDNVKYTSVNGEITEEVSYRTGAGTGMPVAGTLSKGKTVNVCLEATPTDSTKGPSSVWYKIQLNGNYYYVCGSYVNVTGAVVEEPSADNSSRFAKMSDSEFDAYLSSQGFDSTYKTKLIALHKQHPNWAFVAKDTGISWDTAVSKEAGKASMIQGDNTEYRNASLNTVSASLAVYKKTSTSGGTTGKSISTGTSFTILDEVWSGTNMWAHIKTSDGTTGYITYSNGSQKGELYNQSYSKEITGVLNDSDVNIRKGAGTSNKAITSLSKNTKVIIVLTAKDGSGNTWYKIKYNGGYAYILAKYVNASVSGTSGTAKMAIWKPSEGSDWYYANSKTVAYYMDPRNFLNEDRICMFEQLSYQPEYQTANVVKSILEPSQLPAYGFTYDLFMSSGIKYGISPVFLAARARQETGGGSSAINGSKYSGTVVYNPFNIGAYTGVNDGMKYAYNHGWTTKIAAVNGAASFLAGGYINVGQDSIYLQKWNVANGSGNVASHQYMTNIKAPYSEAYTTKSSYQKMGILDLPITFVIPVFKNMPASTSLPS